MSEINNPRAWAEKAEEDFTLAQSALRRKKPLIAGACFHAQQCAEKYIKALLVSKGADFPKTHDLLMLNNLCSEIGVFLEIDPMLLNNLADYAVRTRYPGEGPTLKDAKEAMETVKLIRVFARRFLGI
ncbi:MAG: HEPN domain-containing protein [Anaerolineales bacterium]|nr:HEPN domain-containing protein [Anaerolineales bacterium]